MSNPEIPNTLTARHLVHKIAMTREAMTFCPGNSQAWHALAQQILDCQEALRAECTRHAEAVKGPGPLVRTYSRYGVYYR